MIAYLGLEMLRARRSIAYLTYTIGFPVLFYLLFTTMIRAVPMADGTDYKAYFMVSMALYGSIGAGLTSVAARIAMERTRGWTRLLALTPLRPHSYVAVKVGSASLLSMPVIVLVMLLGGLVNQVTLPWYTWVALFPALLIGALPFAALGVAIGYTLRDEVAQLASLALYFGLSLAGGLWMPTSVFPGWLQAVAESLPTYRAGEVSWRLLAGQSPFGPGLVILLLWTAGFVLLAMWRYRRSS